LGILNAQCPALFKVVVTHREGIDMDFIQPLAQVLLSIGLLYGVIVVFQHWKTTVPPGGGSDAEFVNHSCAPTSRWLHLVNERASRNRPRRAVVDRRDRFMIDRLTHREYSQP
jgi:hypothetical protein